MQLAHTPSTAPLARPLLDFDILEVIISHLAIDLRKPCYDRDKATRGALLNLALSSRQLMEPALCALWRSMDSLRPLYKLIGVFPDEDLDVGSSPYHSELPLIWLRIHIVQSDSECSLIVQAPSTWERWDYYAGKIREYKHGLDSMSIFPATHTLILRLRGTFSTFPNLHSLLIESHVFVWRQRELDYAISSLFAEPTLQRLELSGAGDWFDWHFSLSTLQSYCNDVQSIRLVGHFSSDSLTIVSRFRNLRELHQVDSRTLGRQIHQSFLISLAHLPYLQEIDLDLGCWDLKRLDFLQTIPSFPSSSHTSFPSLKRMTLHGDVPSLTWVVALAKEADLRELDLKIRTPTDAEQPKSTPRDEENIQLLIRRIQKQWIQKLQSFKISMLCDHLGVATSDNVPVGRRYGVAGFMQSLMVWIPAALNEVVHYCN